MPKTNTGAKACADSKAYAALKGPLFHGCASIPYGGRIRSYRAGDLDVCVGYVIPEKTWYIIPAHRVTGRGRSAVTLCQFAGARNRPRYERYREAWELLGKDRRELVAM